MAWQFPPYLFVLLGSAGVALCFAVLTWRRYPAPGSRPFALLMVAVAVWLGFRVLEGAAVETADKILWAKLEYLGIVSVGPLWFLFAWGYSARLRSPSRRTIALLWVVPALTLLIVATNESHGLLWRDVSRTSTVPDALPLYIHGPWFWCLVVYTYGLMFFGTATIVWTVIRFPTFYRRQATALIAGVTIPWFGNLLYITHLFPIPGVDPTPFALTVSGAVVFWVMFRTPLFDVLPVAREVLIERMADGVIVLDANGRIADCNPAAESLLLAAEPLSIGASAHDALRGFPALVALVEQREEMHTEVQTGPTRHIDVRIAPLHADRGQFRGRLILLRDISAHKQAEELLRTANDRLHEQLRENDALHGRLLQESIRDPLTGLYNRRYLWEVLTREFARADRHAHPVSIALVDLDHFKAINDQHGHAAGDWMLQAVGEVLQQQAREGDVICRYGGDEFAVVLPETDAETALAHAARWQHALRALHVSHGETVMRVTLSVGVATYPRDGGDRDTLLRAADDALYAAKHAGRDTVTTALATFAAD